MKAKLQVKPQIKLLFLFLYSICPVNNFSQLDNSGVMTVLRTLILLYFKPAAFLSLLSTPSFHPPLPPFSMRWKEGSSFFPSQECCRASLPSRTLTWWCNMILRTLTATLLSFIFHPSQLFSCTGFRCHSFSSLLYLDFTLLLILLSEFFLHPLQTLSEVEKKKVCRLSSSLLLVLLAIS